MYINPINGEQCDREAFCDACIELMNSNGDSCAICKCTDCPAHI